MARGIRLGLRKSQRVVLERSLAVYVNMHDGRVRSLYAKYDDMPIFWRSETDQRQDEDGSRRLESELKN